MNVKTLATIGLIVVGAFVLRDIFPKTVEIDHPVVIHTVHDTVKSIDTVTLVKRIAELRPDTVYLERQTVSKPETVTVVPALTGLTRLLAGEKPGDTTTAFGFAVEPLGAEHYAIHDWASSFYSTGPLAALKLDGDTLRAAFYPPPKPGCQFGCKVKLLGEGSALGALLALILAK